MKKTSLIFFSACLALNAFSQTSQYRYPLDIPASLSANFGELRPNHFHSGIDLKTQSVVNKSVYSIEDGYVSRISVSPSGYGLALYIAHIDGHTSVYGHLNSYAPKIAKYLKEKQYEMEAYRVDITLEPDLIPIRKGELIAYSGNTGSSFGPHVHFEIRKTDTQEALDPMEFYQNLLTDTQKPVIRGIAVYPMEGEGVVNESNEIFRQAITILKDGSYSVVKNPVYVWGKVGVGINAVDKMNGTSNIYGVKVVRLLCDGQEIFKSDISSFLFEQTRMINSFTDFDYWARKNVFYMKSFVEPGNKLPIFKTLNNGYLDINAEKDYDLHYELEDLHGNVTNYKFTLIGRRQSIPVQRACSLFMAWDQNNHYISESFSLIVPKEYLYTNVDFLLNETPTYGYYSNQFMVHDAYVPMDNYCEMKLQMVNDTLTNKSQYGIVRLKGAKEYWVGGKYEYGYMSTRIRELGNTYAVSYDDKAPVITPVLPAKWVAQGKITIKLSDNKSGIKSYRGTINGEYVLFEHDSKSPNYNYKFDSARLQKGQTHKLVFTATDACDNQSVYEYEFKY